MAVGDSSSSRPNAERVAYHEAGHAAASLLFGYNPHYVSILPDGEDNSAGQAFQLDGDNSTVEDMRNQVIRFYAGAESERLICSPHEHEDVDGHAASDNEEAEWWLQRTGSTEQELRDKTVHFVTANWALIELIAQELMEHKELDWDELGILLEIHHGKASQEDLAEYRYNREHLFGGMQGPPHLQNET